MQVVGLFAGIGGIELGLRAAGHESTLLCEADPGAARVLRERFPGVRLSSDVRTLRSIAGGELVAAGFPCQDLSQAGRTAGIRGGNSGLVGHVFRLLDARKRGPRWLLLENVSFMLQLDRGRGMRFLVDQLESRGFAWAYRVVDTIGFGLPQRRRRVILLASRTEDPREVLYADDAEPAPTVFSKNSWCGFYWTEGLRGLGWAVDAVPTLKGGSTIGIPSPPAMWDPRDGSMTTPEIRDAERLQGFEADWTLPALDVDGVRRGHRWKLVGNAVSVPVARWVEVDAVDHAALRRRQTLWPGARRCQRSSLRSDPRSSRRASALTPVPRRAVLALVDGAADLGDPVPARSFETRLRSAMATDTGEEPTPRASTDLSPPNR